MGKAITLARCPSCGGLLSSKRAAVCRGCVVRRGSRELRPEWDAAQAARVEVERARVEAEQAERRAAGKPL